MLDTIHHRLATFRCAEAPLVFFEKMFDALRRWPHRRLVGRRSQDVSLSIKLDAVLGADDGILVLENILHASGSVRLVVKRAGRPRDEPRRHVLTHEHHSAALTV